MSHFDDWFDDLYTKYFKKMVKTAKYRLIDRQLAEDLVHQVFVELLGNYEKLRYHQDIEGWLFKTLENKVMNENKKAFHSREVELKPEHGPVSGDPYEPGFLESMPPGLSDAERELIYLHDEAGYRHEEIAERLDCTADTSRARLSRAKRRCKKLFEKFLE